MRKIILLLFLSNYCLAQTTPTIKQVLNAGNSGSGAKQIKNIAGATTNNDVLTFPPTSTTTLSITDTTIVFKSGVWKKATVGDFAFGGGSVTAVTATPPIFSSGGAMPNISITSPLPIVNGGTNTSIIGGAGSSIYSDGTKQASTAVGVSGQVLTSAGVGTPTWTTPTTGTVTSVSATSPLSSTGGATPTISITSPLPIVNGGTNATTANSGFNNLSPSQGSNANKFLTTDGSNTSWSTVTLGTSTSGKLPTTQGGTNTNIPTVVVGDLLTGDASNSFQLIADVAVGSIFSSGGVGVIPTWSTTLPSGIDGLYLKLTGRAGGQTANGGTAASENLTLRSTTNATKGKVIFGATGTTVFDEVNNRFGIRTVSPASDLDITSITQNAINLTSSPTEVAAGTHIGYKSTLTRAGGTTDATFRGIDNNVISTSINQAATYTGIMNNISITESGSTYTIPKIRTLVGATTLTNSTSGLVTATDVMGLDLSSFTTSLPSRTVITNYTGILLPSAFGIGVVTTPISLQSSSVATIRHNGSVRIGSTVVPAKTLDVTGNAAISTTLDVGSTATTDGVITGKETMVGGGSGIVADILGQFDIGGETTTAFKGTARGDVSMANAQGCYMIGRNQSTAAGINLIGGKFEWQLAVGATGAPSTAKGILINNPTVTSGSKPTTSTGLEIANQGLSGTTTTYGIRVLAQTGSTTNWGIANEAAQSYTSGNLRVGSTAAPTAYLHLAAGTIAASTAPLKFTSGTSMTASEVGAMEFTTNDLFFTITAGTARKRILMAEDVGGLTSGTTPVATTNGRLTDGVILASGTYTPTLTNTTNVAASTANVAQFMRVGNVVTVSGTVAIDITTTLAASVMGMSLPIASALTLATQLGGQANDFSTEQTAGIRIIADAANDRAIFNWINQVSVANLTYAFSFTYLIL